MTPPPADAPSREDYYPAPTFLAAISGSVDETYVDQDAFFGTGSVSQTQRNIAWVGTETPKQTAPLDFDQRHKISMNLDWSLGKGEGPVWNKWRVFENTGVNALFNIASGTPYTPTKVYNELTLAAVSSEPSGRTTKASANSAKA